MNKTQVVEKDIYVDHLQTDAPGHNQAVLSPPIMISKCSCSSEEDRSRRPPFFRPETASDSHTLVSKTVVSDRND